MRVRQSRAALLVLLFALLAHGLLGSSVVPAAAAGGPAPAGVAAVVADPHGTVTTAGLAQMVARAQPARAQTGRAHGPELHAVCADRVVLPGSATTSEARPATTAAVQHASNASRSRAPPTA